MPIQFIKRYTLNAKHGFTLIELLTVISIIGILVAAATVSWTQAQKKTRDNARKSDLKTIQSALELYFQDNGTYPSSESGNTKCNIGLEEVIDWGGNFTCRNSSGEDFTYLNPMPKDPKGGSADSLIYDYYYTSEESLITPNVYIKYQLSASLENTNDPDTCTASDNCPNLPCAPNETGKSDGGKNYCVIQP